MHDFLLIIQTNIFFRTHFSAWKNVGRSIYLIQRNSHIIFKHTLVFLYIEFKFGLSWKKVAIKFLQRGIH